LVIVLEFHEFDQIRRVSKEMVMGGEFGNGFKARRALATKLLP
jgi:hypothetical protein